MIKPNRIAEIRKAAGLSQSGLAELIGDSTHWVTISNIERGKQALTFEWMKRIAAALKVSPQDLIAAPVAGEPVEIVGNVQAGAWRDPGDTIDAGRVIVPALDRWRNTRKMACRVVGNSMNEIYPDGSIVVWVPVSGDDAPLQAGRRYIVERRRGDLRETTLKEYRVGGDGRQWLVPRTTDPAEQTPIAVDDGPDDVVRIVGRVIWAMTAEE